MRSVQHLAFLLGAGFALPMFAILVVRYRVDPASRSPALGLGLGVFAGILGAIVVVPTSVDLIPDALEGPLVALVIVVVSAALALGSWHRLSRR